MTVTPLTRLQAVNMILAGIGEQPISSLGVSDAPDVTSAVQILDEVNRAVQARGWYYNRECNVELQPDVNGEVVIPLNAAHVDPDQHQHPNWRELAVREGKLYDLTNHTFDLGQSVIKCTIVYMLDFEDSPAAVRQYVAARAAREYQDKQLGDPTLSRNLLMSEHQALAEIQREESRAGDYNIATHSWSVARAVWRRSPLNHLRRRY